MRISLWLLLAVSSLASSIAESSPPPNILFILSDDQRAEFLGCAGHSILKTPHIDRLAQRGTRFTNACVTTAICAASRASILTGLHERTHKYTFGTPPISTRHTEASYPAVLRRAGYRTGFVGKFGVSVLKGQKEAMFDKFVPLNRSPYMKKQVDGSLRHVSEIAGDHAIAFLQEQDKEKPFCLSVSFNAPHAEDGDKENHYPWPKAVDGLYDDLTMPAPRLGDPRIFSSQPQFLRESMNRDRWYWRWDTPEKYQKNVKAYYCMISGVDHVVGRLIEKLDQLGLAENTVVIFNGDNGYYKGDRGFAGKWSHYEESLRVPLIIFDPRQVREAAVDDHPVLNIDIPATVLEYAGIPTPTHYAGRRLNNLAKGRAPNSWRSDSFHEHLFDRIDIPKWEGIRGKRYVYARYFEQDPPFEFLHDLEEDPDQLKNFVGDPSKAE
ncbi:MAG: sulfatase family protein, partial [Verrucomicrobiales bacterium]